MNASTERRSTLEDMFREYESTRDPVVRNRLLEALWHDVLRIVSRVKYAQGRPRGDTLEAVQSTYRRFLQRDVDPSGRPRFASVRELISYLVKVALRVRSPRRPESAIGVVEPVDQHIEWRFEEVHEAVQQILTGLPEQKRVVIVEMIAGVGWDPRIGKRLGVGRSKYYELRDDAVARFKAGLVVHGITLEELLIYLSAGRT